MKRLDTGILVIGGGLAGLCAALEARRAGREVTLLCKRQAGRSGNTVLAACNLSGCFAPEDAAEDFTRDIVHGGQGISDPTLARVLAEESGAIVPFLEGHGIRFLRQGESLLAKLTPGHGRPRTITNLAGGVPLRVKGLSLTLPLLQAARAAGIRLLDATMAVELVRSGGEVRGALALDADDRWLLIRSDSVVLACGGGGRLYAHSNNTPEMTGDGLALAFRAGAELRDLEFVQFHPAMGMAPLRMILPTTLFGDGALLRNRQGERFLLRLCPQGEVFATRDLMSRAIFTEVQEGRGIGGGVHLDLSAIAPETAAGRYQDLWDLLHRRGCDPGRDWLTVGLGVHFFMGGVTIDDCGATTLPGLYAAGEMAGGLHGANRLGGNALVEAVVFGRRAGRAAALFSPRGTAGGQESPVCRLTPRVTGGSEELDFLALKSQRLLWRNAGVVRSASTLSAGLQYLGELEERMQRLDRVSSRKLYCEVRNRLLAARLIFAAALERRESRGAHFRTDFPVADDRCWLGALRVRRHAESGAMEIFFRPG